MPKRKLKCCLLVGGAAFASSANAQLANLPPIVEIQRPPFSESRVAPNRSGSPIIGLVDNRLDTLTPNSAPVLSIGGIKPNSRIICVRIYGASGVYRAAFNADNPRLGPTISFRLPARLLAQGSQVLGGLAVEAKQSIGADCARERNLLPIAWSRRQIGSDIFLAVNSQSAEAVSYRLLNSDLSRNCREINNTNWNEVRRITASDFDYLCKIELKSNCLVPTPILVTAEDVSAPRPSIRANIEGVCL
jgi:hypothetical protein